jgi:large subunit ribosomal protein L13
MAKKFQSNQSTKKQPNQKQPNNSEVTDARVFDAAGQTLGRLASQVTIVLRGKDKPGFRPNLVQGENVKIINAAKIVLTGKKLEDKKYYHHTGYLGNLKTTTAKELMATNPAEILERAIYGMLPDNKLRPEWMKKLVITN